MRNLAVGQNLQYLYKHPKKLNWKVVAGPPDYELNYLQQYDLIYDLTDLKIRKLDNPENLESLKKLPDILLV